MRGKGHWQLMKPQPAGITPAYAGKRIFNERYCLYVWDHPRLCGEKCTKYKLMICTTGSPPPMRGKVCWN